MSLILTEAYAIQANCESIIESVGFIRITNKMFKFEKCVSSFVSDTYDNLNDLLSDSATIRTVDSLTSIQAIQLLIPTNSQALVLDPESTLNHFLNGLYNWQDDSLKYLLIKSTPVHFILHPYFLINYVQNGQLYIQTDNALDELDDYITLINSRLLVCVNQSTYTRLGLVGRLAFGFKKHYHLRKYIVELDLMDISDFNSNHYQRTFNALKNSGLKLDLLIKWVPDNVNCSPQSPIRFFDKLKYAQLNNDEFFDEKSFQSITIHQCGPMVRKFELDQFQMPSFEGHRLIDGENSSSEDEFTHSKLKSFIDSFGLALSGSYLPDECDEDDEVNTLRLDKSKLTNLICLEITGFFTINNIRTILSEQFELIKHNSKLDYTVLIVNGFENSIRSWSGHSNQHHKQLSGENLYGLFLSRLYPNFIWRVGDQHDFGIEKL